ncbi:hypothetical protein COV61_04490, partial [Candidatus Micrarchaeota archaeon CG11_big_fil_rev_8_21_14_0_20_47_5]
RSFLKKPSLKHFFSEKVVRGKKNLKEMIKKRKTKFIALEFSAPNLVEDILWPQLKKTAKAVVSALETFGFAALGHYFWSDGKRCVVFVELLSWQLPAVRKVPGPLIELEKDVEGFMRAHKNAQNLHVEHARIVAIEKRKIEMAEKAVRLAMKNPQKYGVPENFIKCFSRAKFLGEAELLSERCREFVSDYYTRKIE